ncbi:MarR family winged helix-turn-helix transcriptional regulator [Amycolatopsis sp. NPDC051903]|uniref:MarR family winged helix-turn-helix transcriptional regulator n=1 Tax=Amycolatopsis sp. NPDC051903 TaxID=3363936 RepID=UPI0037B546FD
MRDTAIGSSPPPRAPGPVTLALPPDTTAGHLIRRAQQVHTALWSAEVGVEVTGPQYAILSALSRRSGVDQVTAGRAASLDKSTTADIVDRLRRKAWIRRDRDAGDGRRYLLSLTPSAKEMLPGLTARVEAVQDRLLRPLGPNLRRSFGRLLGQVAYQGPVPTAGKDEDEDVEVLRLGSTPGHLIRRAEQVHGALWSRHVGTRLTPSQYALLCSLVWRPAIDQTAAGEMASLDKSSAADIVARLRRRGWLLDTRDEADRRRKLLVLTDLARETLAEVTPAVQTVQRELVAPLPPAEQDKLISLLRRVAYR